MNALLDNADAYSALALIITALIITGVCVHFARKDGSL